MLKKFLIITILILILLGGIIVYALFLDREEPVKPVDNNSSTEISKPDDNNENNQNEYENENQDTIENNDISEIDSSDWKTYINEEFGFEIEHPKDWRISTRDYRPRGYKIFISGSSNIGDPLYAPLSITVRDNKERLSVEKWFQKNYPKDDISKLQNVKFNGIDGIRFSNWPSANIIGSFYFSNKDKIYEIRSLDSQENVENQRMMTEKMLSTFKFIEPVDNTIWKTYQNEEFGFEIEYPSALYFFDCSKNFYEPNPLHVHFTPYVEDNCNTPGKAMASVISISTVKDFNKNNIISLLDKKIKEEKIIIGNKSAVKISGDREVTGDEGEKISSAPIRKMVYTIIPFKNNISIQISYNRIASIKNDINGFYVGENLSKIYNQMLSTFKFINP